ncbi:hypothetical protein LCGC14_0812150 [marine sediment metagenome]|uniref:Uncharacterized protein n=1 Tax=marine sediment metagenome TaxID=412755 RepID=A0A0F9Q6K4_9ZZZZ
MSEINATETGNKIQKEYEDVWETPLTGLACTIETAIKAAKVEERERIIQIIHSKYLVGDTAMFLENAIRRGGGE